MSKNLRVESYNNFALMAVLTIIRHNLSKEDRQKLLQAWYEGCVKGIDASLPESKSRDKTRYALIEALDEAKASIEKTIMQE